MVQRYEKTELAVGNGCLVLPILLHRYLVNYGPGGVTFLTHITAIGAYKGTTMRAKKAPHMEKRRTERPSHSKKAPPPPPISRKT